MEPPATLSRAWPQRRPHQRRALAALADVYTRAPRAQLHWACGTGKTLVGRWFAEDAAADLTLVVVPSLALIAQQLAEWQAASPWRFDALVVCSDRTTVDSWRVDPEWWTGRGVQVTTDPAAVVRFLAAPAGLPRVVFSTYHSAHLVGVAARRARTRFDLLVCDEAHRLAGQPDDRFQVVLDDGLLPARRRLAVTATPIHAPADSGLISMGDKALFGPVADRVDFGDAITAGLLVDYQVLVLDNNNTNSLDRGQRVPAAIAAAAREGLTRLISYHSRVYYARQFAADIDGLVLPDGRTVRAVAVAGTDSTATRRAALDVLAADDPTTLRVVANARCLTEGVDIPAVDGVIFADPKTSGTDTVQAIGRALRPAPNKTRGMIILPVTVADTEDTDDLYAGPYAAVWGVLRALRAMDVRMAAVLDRVTRVTSPTSRPGPTPGYERKLVRFDIDGVDLTMFAARIINPARRDTRWPQMRAALADWAHQHGHTAVPPRSRHQELHLGRWVHAQRRAYAAGALPIEQATQLDNIPGWAWTTDGAWWEADRNVVLAYADRRLDLTNPTITDQPLRRRGDQPTLTIGQWCARQRRAYRDLDLAARHIGLCEQIPGWDWTAGTPERELRMADALAEWVEQHGDANVPHDAMWGTLPLGRFITAVRRRRCLDTLTATLAADIAVVTPTRGNPGALDWQPAETRWDLHYLALRQYAERTGGVDIPEHGTEILQGRPFRIFEWAVRQRYNHRHGHLNPGRVGRLEQIPGWRWERARKTRVTVGIGARQHGTRLGYAAGCLCEPCTAGNTAYEAKRQRSIAAGQATTNLVDVRAARGHLRILEGQIGSRARKAMQQVTGLNIKTIAEVSSGTRKRILPEVDQALRALTADQLRDHITANPSPRDQLPAEPTLDLIDELVTRGWPKAWISREIGGNGRALQIARTGVVYRETAEAVAHLHAKIGNLVPPPRPARTPLPALAEILATTQPIGGDQ